MTRILVQRGSGGSSSNPNRSQQLSAPQATASALKDEEQDNGMHQEAGGSLDELLNQCSSSEQRPLWKEEFVAESSQGARNEVSRDSNIDYEKCHNDEIEGFDPTMTEFDRSELPEGSDGLFAGSPQIVMGPSYPPPPPVPPPKPSGASFLAPKRTMLGGSNATRTGSFRRQSTRPVLPARSDSRPSSPKTFGEAEGYNSSDEQGTCFGSSYDDVEKERLFEIDIKRVKGLEVRRMLEDGNCLFRAVADQVYGDPELYDMTRQMCIDYMERERDHYSQFITESFSSYCKRKRRDKVYGNNMEIQAFSEMYNRPIHIYSYSTEPINIFHGGYNTDTPPIRLSYHHGNHYNSLVDPRQMTIGAGLGFSNLQGVSIDKDQVKAAIKAQQDQQIDNALLAEGRFYSDLELTEKEMERMVMEASRAEYLSEDKFKQQHGFRESSTSAAEPSSSGARSSNFEGGRETVLPDMVLNNSMQIVLSMGFGYLQVMEAYSIFGDDVDSMVCYLLELGGGSCSPGNSRQKGKAAE